jgi:hypothetical protein
MGFLNFTQIPKSYPKGIKIGINLGFEGIGLTFKVSTGKKK